MDTKLMMDIVTGVIEEIRMRGDFGWARTEEFCEKLEAAFKDAAPVEAAALTDDEIVEICERECGWLAGAKDSELVKFARAIEARIKGGAK